MNQDFTNYNDLSNWFKKTYLKNPNPHVENLNTLKWKVESRLHRFFLQNASKSFLNSILFNTLQHIG